MSTLKPITCAACGASAFEHDAEGNLICTHCGTKFASPREEIICPTCGTSNPAGAIRCMNCGLALGKLCPVCNTPNLPGAEVCIHCATPLDTLAAISTRKGEGKRISDAMREQRLVEQKGGDAIYMAEQRARIEAEERVRLEQLAAQQAESRRQQTTVIIVAVGLVMCLVIAGAALLLLTAASR